MTAMKFGLKQHEKCRVTLPIFAKENLTEFCRTHQRKIFENLIPNFVNATGLHKVFISETGNPKNSTKHWIKVSPPEMEPQEGRNESDGYICTNMIILVKFEFRFGRLKVSGLSNQNVLKEVLMQFGPKVDLKFTNDDNSVPIYTQIQFLDLTASAGSRSFPRALIVLSLLYSVFKSFKV